MRILLLLAMLCAGCGNYSWPVSYSFAPELTAEQRGIYQTAIDRWNTLAGRDVLVAEKDGLELTVTDECPGNPEALGCGGPGLGAALVWARIPEELRIAVATHEVGHVLDLYDIDCVDTATMCSHVIAVPPWPAAEDTAEFERSESRNR